MIKRFLSGVLSIIAGTALVLTSFAGACSEDAGGVNGPPIQETPSEAFRGPSVAVAENATTTSEPEPEPEPEPEENITYENVAIPEIHIHRKKK